MRNFTIILCFPFLFLQAPAQEPDSSLQIHADDFNTLMLRAKDEYKKAFEDQDYSVAVELLERAVSFAPENAEAHYFLAYAYSRVNSKDGKSMIAMSLPLTLKCSEELELVNKHEPRYSGEIIVLDPYSKLSAEWGAMAMCYFHNNKPDSARWAFLEGKKRGGFSDFILGTNRAVLDQCSKNSILISSGDNFTIPLWYLQIAEGYRNDVSVIDVSLLNTSWYPKLLSLSGKAAFDIPAHELDTMEYCRWNDSLIQIGNLTWTVPSRDGIGYIYRGDRILLSLLRTNNFEREVFFTTSFMPDCKIGLNEKNFRNQILVDKLNHKSEEKLGYKKFLEDITDVLKQAAFVNMNSHEERRIIDSFRFLLMHEAMYWNFRDETKKVKKLMATMDNYASDKQFPFRDEKYSGYAEIIRNLSKK